MGRIRLNEPIHDVHSANACDSAMIMSLHENTIL